MTAAALRRPVLLAVAAAVLAALLGAALWRAGEAVAGYTAKVLCSCVFVSGRPEASCLAEDGGAVARFAVARIDRDGRAATARAFVGPSARATWRPGRGCTVDSRALVLARRQLAGRRRPRSASSSISMTTEA